MHARCMIRGGCKEACMRQKGSVREVLDDRKLGGRTLDGMTVASLSSVRLARRRSCAVSCLRRRFVGRGSGASGVVVPWQWIVDPSTNCQQACERCEQRA